MNVCHCRHKPSRVRWLGMLCLIAALGLPACSQDTSWEAAMVAGQQAYTKRQYDEALRAFNAAVIKAEAFGREDPRLAHALTQLAHTYAALGQDLEAEPQFLRALSIFQAAQGEHQADIAATLNNLGVLNRRHGQFAEAQPQLEQALAIKERMLGPEHLDVALGLQNLAVLHAQQDHVDQALPLYQRALEIREKTLGPRHQDTVKTRQEVGALLRKLNRSTEADVLERSHS